MTRQTDALLFENAKIIFRNFSGIAREFNSEGDRNFSIIVPPEQAQKLKETGWRIKQLKPRGEEEEGDYHLKVKLNYKTGRPPRCVLISSRGRNELGQDEVSILDVADIKKVDVMVNGYWSDMAGGGFTGYLKSIFVTIEEDALELKYAEVDDSNQTPAGGLDDWNE